MLNTRPNARLSVRMTQSGPTGHAGSRSSQHALPVCEIPATRMNHSLRMSSLKLMTSNCFVEGCEYTKYVQSSLLSPSNRRTGFPTAVTTWLVDIPWCSGSTIASNELDRQAAMTVQSSTIKRRSGRLILFGPAITQPPELP